MFGASTSFFYLFKLKKIIKFFFITLFNDKFTNFYYLNVEKKNQIDVN